MTRYLLPLGAFLGLVVLLGIGLGLDPRLVPSPLVGKPVPEFQLAQLEDPARELTRADLEGKVSLLNVWATWCVGCREEHPLLMRVAGETEIPIYGINYKDERGAALRWLERFGNPYVASGFDGDGRVGIDLGVYGLPETFVVDRHGNIAYKHIGPITPAAWQEKIAPAIARLLEEKG